MSVSVFDNPLLARQFGDRAVAEMFSAEAQIAHMLAFEQALTGALEETGRIDAEAAEAARARIAGFLPDIAVLAEGAAMDGVVVPALVRALREDCAAPEAIHTGATSQDVVDTALALTLRALSAELDVRLGMLLADLDDLALRFGERRIMGRTRMQAALPIAAGHRLAAWRRPLAEARADLAGLTDRAAQLQLGGPVGDRSGLGADADRIAAILADRLGLPDPGHAWHGERGAVVAYGAGLARLSGALGKIGQDVALMAQQGIDEVKLAGGGGSSAMAHKENPVDAEILVTLSRFAAGLSGTLAQALVHEQERSGAAWLLEWMVLPQMAAAAARGLTAARSLLAQVTDMGVPSG